MEILAYSCGFVPKDGCAVSGNVTQEMRETAEPTTLQGCGEAIAGTGCDIRLRHPRKRQRRCPDNGEAGSSTPSTPSPKKPRKKPSHKRKVVSKSGDTLPVSSFSASRIVGLEGLAATAAERFLYCTEVLSDSDHGESDIEVTDVSRACSSSSECLDDAIQVYSSTGDSTDDIDVFNADDLFGVSPGEEPYEIGGQCEDGWSDGCAFTEIDVWCDTVPWSSDMSETPMGSDHVRWGETRNLQVMRHIFLLCLSPLVGPAVFTGKETFPTLTLILRMLNLSAKPVHMISPEKCLDLAFLLFWKCMHPGEGTDLVKYVPFLLKIVSDNSYEDRKWENAVGQFDWSPFGIPEGQLPLAWIRNFLRHFSARESYYLSRPVALYFLFYTFVTSNTPHSK
jgi:hypothetical protein